MYQRRRFPLVVRARFAWTFFGAGLFAALSLFLCGFYLLAEMIRDPLRATEAPLVSGGFMLALASFLLLYVVWPRAKTLFRRERMEFDNEPHDFRGSILTVYRETVHIRLDPQRDATKNPAA